MNNIFIPSVSATDGKTIEVQILKDNNSDNLIITGLIDEEIEESVYLSLSNLKRLGFGIPKFLHIHFKDYNYRKAGISASLGIYLLLFSFINNMELKKTYMVTGEIDLFGNVYSIGGVKQKYSLFKNLDLDYFIVPYGNISDLNKTDVSIKSVSNLNELINIVEECENEIK